MDLILKFGQKLIADACRASKSPHITREFWNAIDDVKPDETWVVSPVYDAYPLKENVWVMPLDEALKKMDGIQQKLFD